MARTHVAINRLVIRVVSYSGKVSIGRLTELSDYFFLISSDVTGFGVQCDTRHALRLISSYELKS